MVNLASVTTSQLEYLAAALDSPTWRDAATRVGVTPSALSQGIAELERRLGLTLFEREGRRRSPTDEAHQVRVYADRMLAELRELTRWATEVREGTSGQVSIGMIDTAAIHHFGDTLVGFRAEHPEIGLHLVVAPSGQLLDQLFAGQVDAAVVVDPDPDPRLIATPLISEALHVYAPPGAGRARPGAWGPWVGFPAGSRTRSRIEAALRKLGSRYEVVAESSQPAVLREMVHLGMGWCVLPVTDAEAEPHALTPARKRPVAERHLTLVRRSDRAPSTALTTLLAEIESVAATRHQRSR